MCAPIACTTATTTVGGAVLSRLFCRNTSTGEAFPYRRKWDRKWRARATSGHPPTISKTSAPVRTKGEASDPPPLSLSSGRRQIVRRSTNCQAFVERRGAAVLSDWTSRRDKIAALANRSRRLARHALPSNAKCMRPLACGALVPILVDLAAAFRARPSAPHRLRD
jgi:hypothetical protein